jgi:hypothetical protein
MTSANIKPENRIFADDAIMYKEINDQGQNQEVLLFIVVSLSK